MQKNKPSTTNKKYKALTTLLCILVINTAFAQSYNGFKSIKDYIYWERADTIEGKIYTQAERLAFIDSTKADYRNGEYYKAKWARTDTIAGKHYTIEEKDAILDKQFREQMSRQNEEFFKEMEEKHRKPEFDLSIFLAVLFGVGILALIIYAKDAYKKEIAEQNMTPEERAQKKLLDSMTLEEKINMHRAADNQFQERLAKTITDSITNTGKTNLPIRIEGNCIHISSSRKKAETMLTIVPVFKITELPFSVSIYEDDNLYLEYTLDFRQMKGYDQSLQYFHAEVRINPNDSVQIDGILSDNRESHPTENPSFRFQPFYLNNQEKMAKGNNSFEIGLNYSGYITPPNVRFICICSACETSFSLDKWHCGFSETNFAYATNGIDVTSVRQGDIENGPYFYTGIETLEHIENFDKQLPKLPEGAFKYLNPLRCPHCKSPFFDYENNRESRRQEYYCLYHPTSEK